MPGGTNIAEVNRQEITGCQPVSPPALRSSACVAPRPSRGWSGVAFRIVQVSVTPPPGHHLRLLSENESALTQSLAEIVELAHLGEK